MAADWAYARIYLNNDAPSAALPAWQHDDHTERAHTALGGHPPISRVVSPP